MARGRGGARGGRGGRRAGGGDAASSGDLPDSAAQRGTSKRTGKGRSGGASVEVADLERGSLKRAQRHEDMYDEVDDFHANRGRIALNEGATDDENEDEDGVGHQQQGISYELEGLDEDDDDNDEEDEDAAGAAEDYDAIERKEAEAARQRELQAEENITKGWGSRKSTYHGADTVDFEIESDEEIAANEEAEGRRLQEEQMKQIEGEADEAEDMLAMIAAEEEEKKGEKSATSASKKKTKVGSGSSDADLLRAMDEDLDAMTFDLDTEAAFVEDLPAPSARKKKSANTSVLVEKIAKDVASLSDSAKMEALLTTSPELLSLLDDFKLHMAELHELLPRWEAIRDDEQESATPRYCYLALKVESLLTYCSHVSFYLSLKAAGTQNTKQHPVMKTLLQLRQTIKSLDAMDEHFIRQAQMDAALDEDEALESPLEVDEAEDGANGLDGEEDYELADDVDADAGGFGGEEEEEDPSDLAHVDLMARQESQLERLLAGVSQPTKGKTKGARAAASRASALSDFGEVNHRAELAKNITIGKATGKLAALQAKIVHDAAEQKKAAHKRQIHTDATSDEEDQANGAPAKKKTKGGDDAAAAAYAEAAARKKAAKEARAAQYTWTRTDIGTQPVALGESDHRKVTRQIDANRGLVRLRDKQRKTPKTRNRARYDKRQVARNGQVQLFKGSEAANYGGQATGIKTNVTKSISLK